MMNSKKSANLHKLIYLVCLTILISLFFVACSEDENIKDINGYWQGESTNSLTNKSWPIEMFLEQEGENIDGVYKDYHGSFTIRNVNYNGKKLGFVIDIYPYSVTFFGDVNRNVMVGTWSNATSGANGTWFLIRDEPDFPTAY